MLSPAARWWQVGTQERALSCGSSPKRSALGLTARKCTPAVTDLGRLLHKHPEWGSRFLLPFGQAHVFYPPASEERCTAALMLEVDSVGWRPVSPSAKSVFVGPIQLVELTAKLRLEVQANPEPPSAGRSPAA
jgi:Hen1-like subunit of RNA repair complex